MLDHAFPCKQFSRVLIRIFKSVVGHDTSGDSHSLLGSLLRTRVNPGPSVELLPYIDSPSHRLRDTCGKELEPR